MYSIDLNDEAPSHDLKELHQPTASMDDSPSSATHASRRPVLEHRNSAIDSTILSPGIVKINVQGAFNVNEDHSLSAKSAGDGAQHDTDIRLPNHRGVVSHVALDVCANYSMAT